MGINLNTLKALSILEKNHAIKGKSLLTLGRQNSCFKSGDFSTYFTNDALYKPFFHQKKQLESFADNFLLQLGFSSVESIDYSNFEGANLVHDLNIPIPEVYVNNYDVIIDGGTLEHVFNFPTAITSCIQMVKDNGHLIITTPANNMFGHGFYQFSPELFYRIFSKENGFEIIAIFVNGKKPGTWYKVADPQQVSERVALRNDYETELVVVAKKIMPVKQLTIVPQQSDYQTLWNHEDVKRNLGLTTLKAKYQKLVPKEIRDRIWTIRNKKNKGNIGYFKNGHFKPLDK